MFDIFNTDTIAHRLQQITTNENLHAEKWLGAINL